VPHLEVANPAREMRVYVRDDEVILTDFTPGA
jgi:hypothetical protein